MAARGLKGIILWSPHTIGSYLTAPYWRLWSLGPLPARRAANLELTRAFIASRLGPFRNAGVSHVFEIEGSFIFTFVSWSFPDSWCHRGLRLSAGKWLGTGSKCGVLRLCGFAGLLSPKKSTFLSGGLSFWLLLFQFVSYKPYDWSVCSD